MKPATSKTVCSNAAPAARGGARSSADVDRWVAMIDADLRSEDVAPTTDGKTVTVALEFGRGTIDLAAQPLTAGSSLRLDQLADEPLDLVVEGRRIARGELVIVDGQLGVRIVELLMLVAAWIIVSASPSLADERPGSFLFDNETERLETPFGSVRGSRATLEAEHSRAAPTNPIDERSNSITTPLPRRSDAATRDANRNHGGATGWSATVWPLLLVVGLIVVGARWLKSRSPSPSRGLPVEAFEVLGRKAIDPRTSVVLARCGSRLLVLNLSPHGLRTLAEITDPVEIDCLAGLCRAAQRDQTLADVFRSLLHKPSESKPAMTSPKSSASASEFEERLVARRTSARSVATTSLSEARP